MRLIRAQVEPAVYSFARQKVATLVDAPMTAERHEAIFDGAGLSSGVMSSGSMSSGP